MSELFENVLFLIVILMLAFIGFKYAQGVNQVGTALTDYQIRKYKNDTE